MKNKAKRTEYQSLKEFCEDYELLRANAELFNGLHSPIAERARDLEKFAKDLVKQQEGDISNYELLVSESKGAKLI